MTQTNVNVQMQIRRDTAANWQSSNPVLLAGEWGYITDTGKFKIGDGSTSFTFLDEAVLSTKGGVLTDHLEISNQKELRLTDAVSGTSSEHYSSFKAGSQSANINYTLPTTAPTDNQYLKCSAAGVLSWDTFTGTDLADLLSNDANNRILTATGTTNSFNAEANLTFDGSTLAVTGAITSTGNITITNDAPKIFLNDGSNNPDFSLQNANGAFVVFDDTNSQVRIEVDADGKVGIGGAPSQKFHVNSANGNICALFESTDSEAQIRIKDDGDSTAIIAVTDGKIAFENTDGSLVTFHKQGDVQIHDGNLKLADGHGIDFSATSDATGKSSELLNDYEEGTWTPDIRFSNDLSTANQCTYSSRSGQYTKVGRVVTVQAFYNISNFNSNTGNMFLFGLPFTPASGTQPIMHHIGDGFNFGSNEFGTTFVLIDASNDRGIMGWQRQTGWSHMTHLEMESGGMYITGVYYA